MLTYRQARETVISRVQAAYSEPVVEHVPLETSLGRVLAADCFADRDYPPFHRSTRDGFAVRATDVTHVPVALKLVGEVRAGDRFQRTVEAGECVEIMTGAPVPTGADAVVMVEYTETRDEQVKVSRSVAAGANIVPQGSEVRAGSDVLSRGIRVGYTEISLLGQIGMVPVPVFRRPRVAVLSTGDEVVPVGTRPGPNQIRNSNSYSLGAQVTLAGGEPVLLGNARDEMENLEEYIHQGLQEDLLVLTGGVSMGKYDLVEAVLRKLGAEFYFDALAIRPGRPAVFGRCKDKFVFGLPGNPVSTMVTFELLVAPALAVLSGADAPPVRYFMARLAEPVKQAANLTLFVPALLERRGEEVLVRPLQWKGSGDVAGLVQSNCYLIVPKDAGDLAAGTLVNVLVRLGGEGA